jgi:hypothetical protein
MVVARAEERRKITFLFLAVLGICPTTEVFEMESGYAPSPASNSPASASQVLELQVCTLWVVERSSGGQWW